MLKDVVNPVIVAIILGVGALGYAKFEAYENLLTKLPQVEEDLRRLEESHSHVSAPIGYTSFKAKTRLRLDYLENKKEVNLKPLFSAINRDSIRIDKTFIRLEYLKSLH